MAGVFHKQAGREEKDEPVKPEVLLARLAGFREKMHLAEVEAIIVQKPENRGYLSGFEGSAGVLFITQTRALLLVDFRYVEQAKMQAPNFEVLQYGNPLSATLCELVQKHQLKTIGFEQDYVTWEQFETWSNRLGDLVALVPLPDLALKLRLIKGPEELRAIQQAANIADRAFVQVLPYIKPGCREIEIAIELEYRMRCLGAKGTAFETIVASGPRSSLPHGTATQRICQPGDLVTIDFGAIYQGYCSDCTRTVCVGVPDDQQISIYLLVQQAQTAALQAIKPGATAASIDAVAREIISQQGYAARFGHPVGHGVGRLVHEEPSLTAKDLTLLEPGMVITVEPGVYLPDWGGVRIEDLVLVTATGYEKLTHCPKGLETSGAH